MKHVISALLAVSFGAAISSDASADGHRAWQGPNPFSDFTNLSGTWVIEYKPVYSSCPDRSLASASTSVWTITYRNGAYTATNASQVTFQSVELTSTPPSILFRQTKAPRSNAIQLWFSGRHELTGRRWLVAPSKAKDDAVCIVYQDVTATKQQSVSPKRVRTSGLPAECLRYGAAIEALAKCDKLSQQARDALRQAYEQTAAAWASIPPEGKANLATACKAAADAVTQSTAACR